jgi:hypothetical protein
MARPMTVAEDEALKFYRLKNLMTPPELIELSELDREMSNILSRTDISSKQKAVLYYRALVKFRNLFKDLLPGMDIFKDNEVDDKDSNGVQEKELETTSDIELEQDMDSVDTVTGDERKKDEVEESDEKVIDNVTAKTSPTSQANFFEIFGNKSSTSPTSSPSPKKIVSPKKKTPSPKIEPEAKKRRSMFSHDKETEDIMEHIQEAIDEKVSKGKIKFERSLQYVEWVSKNGSRKRYPIKVWNDILGYLLQSKLGNPPKFGKNEKPSAVRDIAGLLFNFQLIKRDELESYPNFAQLIENVGIRKSVTPAEFRPKVSGTGIKVNFKKWNQFLLNS